MKTRHFVAFAVGIAALSLAATAPAQVIIRGTESSDNSAAHSEVTVNTMDRTVVPLIKNTQQTKPSLNTEVTETLTRSRLNDGSYFDSQRSTTVKKQISPDITEVSTAIVEKDRQGGDRMTGRKTETVVKNDRGETSETKVYTRNSAGQLVLDQVVDADTVTNATGGANTTRVVKTPDVSGNIIVSEQIEEATVEKGPKEKVTTALTRSVDHRTGRLDVTQEATTTVRTDVGVKEINTVVRTPGRMGWEVNKQTTTTEKATPDGSKVRETIEHGRSLYAVHTGDQLMEPLVPQRRIVEQEARRPDGTITVQREVFRRDVNGEWRHESFSTDQPDTSIGQRPPLTPPKDNEPVAPPVEAARPAMQPH